MPKIRLDDRIAMIYAVMCLLWVLDIKCHATHRTLGSIEFMILALLRPLFIDPTEHQAIHLNNMRAWIWIANR